MKLFRLALLVGTLLVFFAPVSAVAGTQHCPQEMRKQNACAAWQRAEDLRPYHGPVARTREPMSCAYMEQAEHSALLLYEGSYVKDPDREHVKVIGHIRNVGWKQIKPRVWRIEICVPKRWMRKVITFTVCGADGHYSFNAIETRQFKRQHGRLKRDDIARMWDGG